MSLTFDSGTDKKWILIEQVVVRRYKNTFELLKLLHEDSVITLQRQYDNA